MRIRTLFAAALLPALLTLSACGNGPKNDGVASVNGGKAKGTASPTATLSQEDAQLKFAQCMRQNGVQVEDPDPNNPGKISIKAEGKGKGKVDMDAAQKKCGKFLQQGGMGGHKPTAKELDQMVKMAQCLRDHGLDAKDPDENGGMRMNVKEGMDPKKVEQAQKECQQKYPEIRK
ncbi:hypothetical protein BTM25_35970 [Actinomadura rubteroloni]|uniref:Uncharacterized protein n=1 Tax=Actinomadura rubteroloni TaxID=1926885 RepID=A0A2P4UIX5_9ACTN|nr:hypothetical protein [Actinomadura rubteroloni]POM24958.1 hypothetical protein BTM25_35970 [Actinomadura rubteroloni]